MQGEWLSQFSAHYPLCNEHRRHPFSRQYYLKLARIAPLTKTKGAIETLPATSQGIYRQLLSSRELTQFTAAACQRQTFRAKDVRVEPGSTIGPLFEIMAYQRLKKVCPEFIVAPQATHRLLVAYRALNHRQDAPIVEPDLLFLKQQNNAVFFTGAGEVATADFSKYYPLWMLHKEKQLAAYADGSIVKQLLEDVTSEWLEFLSFFVCKLIATPPKAVSFDNARYTPYLVTPHQPRDIPFPGKPIELATTSADHRMVTTVLANELTDFLQTIPRYLN